MAVVSYEGTMLGAILFTVLGIIFESRLPKLKLGLYDARITEGYIGVLVNAEETQHGVEDSHHHQRYLLPVHDAGNGKSWKRNHRPAEPPT